jgi:dienelactone hydrolase
VRDIWSTARRCAGRNGVYDRPFLDCLTEIDSAIGRLKGRGASRIVVAGMSQGGDAALAYGAHHAQLAGINALAPAAAPERQIGLADIAQSVAQARALVVAGRDDETASFADRNVGREDHGYDLFELPESSGAG